MKGFIIFEDFKKLINCKEILDGYYNCVISDYPNGTFSGVINRVTGARCNKDDTYDFETGALIALMKMCGVDKVVRACNEAFSEDTFKTYATKYERELNTLKKDFDKVRDLKDFYKKNYNERLEENKNLKKNIDELFESDKYWKSEAGRLSFEKHRLEEKVEKLKLDCEKLQHGYIDTDVIFCGGRQNGKQYTLLVDLFKKMPQNKVDEAYKEAYNVTLPVWQKEVFKQLRKDQLDSLLEAGKYAFPYTTEWIKPPTKRDEMWENIFALHKESDVIIKVKREDINTFLHELENKIPEITWVSGGKIFETKYTIKDIYFELKTCDMIYFRLHRENKLSYSNDPHIYRYRELKHIDYLPPMRWDLFKKGRIAVKVTYNNRKEFYESCEKELGKKPSIYPMLWNGVTISISKKDGNFEIFTMEDQKKTGRKIVDWEDVR